MSKCVKTAPERIWLAVSDEAEDFNEPFPNNGEVTWAGGHPPTTCSVAYVRADLVAAHARVVTAAEKWMSDGQTGSLDEIVKEIYALRKATNSQ